MTIKNRILAFLTISAFVFGSLQAMPGSALAGLGQSAAKPNRNLHVKGMSFPPDTNASSMTFPHRPPVHEKGVSWTHRPRLSWDLAQQPHKLHNKNVSFPPPPDTRANSDAGRPRHAARITYPPLHYRGFSWPMHQKGESWQARPR